jgi:hypothetical protein
LGWEGNTQVVIPLIELLYDPDINVQQTAVSALSNLRNDRITGLMLERLEHGPLEQKRSIFFNLWRFYPNVAETFGPKAIRSLHIRPSRNGCPFSRSHRMCNTLSSLKMFSHPLLTQSIAF